MVTSTSTSVSYSSTEAYCRKSHCKHLPPTYTNVTLSNRHLKRQNWLPFMIILMTWSVMVRGRPNGQRIILQRAATATTSSSLSDSTELTDWQPLTRPNYGPSSSLRKSQRNWSWKGHRRLSDSFILHHFHKLHLLNDSTALCNDGSHAG